MGEPDVGLPLWVNHPVVAGMAIDLQDADKALQNIHCMFAGSPRRVSERHAGWVISIPWSVIPGQSPEVSPLHLALAGIGHRGGCLVHEELGGSLQVGHQRVVNGGQFLSSLAHPCRRCGPVEINTLTGLDLRLPAER